jgi:hypothetical protein
MGPVREADRRLAALARRQHGVVTRAQAIDSGLSASGWGRRLSGGYLVALHEGVARFASAPSSDEQRILAAVLAAGEGAMASHTAAAFLWDVELDGWAVEVIVPDRSRSPRLPGVQVHRPRDLLDLTPSRRRGVPVTSPLRVLVDLGAVVPEADVERALEQFVVSRVVSLAGVQAVLARHGRPGRTGVGALRAVLDRWMLSGGIPDAEFECTVARLLDVHGLPRPVFHHVISGYEVDFAYPELRIAIEVDGWADHGRRGAFESDRARDLALHAAGWVVLRLTWLALTNRPGTTLELVRKVMALRAAA